MADIEIASTDHANGICRVGTKTWRDAYRSVLPSEYVEANVRLRYDVERIAGQIEGGANTDSIGEWLVALYRGTDEISGREQGGDDSNANELVVGTVRDDRPEPDVGEVSNLYVDPDLQGEGVGSRLLETLTERQCKDGVDEQHAYVFADNDAAISFYESKGFTANERFAAATVDNVEPDCAAIQFLRSL